MNVPGIATGLILFTSGDGVPSQVMFITPSPLRPISLLTLPLRHYRSLPLIRRHQNAPSINCSQFGTPANSTTGLWNPHSLREFQLRPPQMFLEFEQMWSGTFQMCLAIALSQRVFARLSSVTMEVAATKRRPACRSSHCSQYSRIADSGSRNSIFCRHRPIGGDSKEIGEWDFGGSKRSFFAIFVKHFAPATALANLELSERMPA